MQYFVINSYHSFINNNKCALPFQKFDHFSPAQNWIRYSNFAIHDFVIFRFSVEITAKHYQNNNNTIIIMSREINH